MQSVYRPQAEQPVLIFIEWIEMSSGLAQLHNALWLSRIGIKI